MKIERVYIETELQTLEKGIVESTAVVERWRANLNSINTQIADAQARLAKAAAHRKEFALHAKLGNAQASADLAKARAEQVVAEADLKDLSVALDDTNLQLHEAEAAAASANRALAKFEADGLKRERIVLAGEIDSAIAELARLLAEFDDLGAAITAKEPAPANIHGMPGDNSGVIGLRRVAAALPTSMKRLFPGAHHDEIQKMPLMTSESRIWNLPTLAPVETKAA
jgi:chromosome segregation ATPase